MWWTDVREAMVSSFDVTKPTSEDIASRARTTGGRLQQLDGLRAIAIGLVVAFHYFARWAPPHNSSSVYPYGNSIVGFHLLEYGAYGVQLFFMISGFVIALTLEACRTRHEFFVRRFARLWPALIMTAAATYTIIRFLPVVPEFRRGADSILPSFTLMSPQLLNLLHLPSADYVDGVLWSLWVEVLFYILAGLVYFAARRFFLPVMVTAASALSLLALWVKWGAGVNDPWLLSKLAVKAGSITLAFPLATHIWWFIFGIAMYQLWRGRNRSHAIAAGVVAVVMQSVTSLWLARWGPGSDSGFEVFLLALFGCFVAGVFWNAVARPLSSRPLTAVGRSSYSLYLMHQAIGVTLIVAVGSWLNWAGPTSLILGFLIAASLIAVALLMHRIIELPGEKLIRTWLLLARPESTPAPGQAPQV